MTKRAIAGLFLIGCAVGTASSAFIVPTVRAGTAPQKWEYVCANLDPSASEATSAANRAGAQGWEMAGLAGGGQGILTMCFKRPLP